MNRLEQLGIAGLLLTLLVTGIVLWSTGRHLQGWAGMANGPMLLLIIGTFIVLAVLAGLTLTRVPGVVWVLRALILGILIVSIHELLLPNAHQSLAYSLWAVTLSSLLFLAGIVKS